MFVYILCKRNKNLLDKSSLEVFSTFDQAKTTCLVHLNERKVRSTNSGEETYDSYGRMYLYEDHIENEFVFIEKCPVQD